MWFKRKKETKQIETELQITAGDGRIITLYVKTNSPDKALELIKELKRVAREDSI